MPGPGGRRAGPGGYGGGPRGGRGPPPPPAPGMFFGGPGLRPGGGRPRGPRGTSCCCWVWLCAIAFVVLASLGITLIESLENCTAESTDQDDDETAQSTCYEYEVVWAAGMGVLALCCCCCCMRPSDGGYQPIDGTHDERQHMLATEAHPPPRVYGDPSYDPSKLTV
eukprot:g2156.t1